MQKEASVASKTAPKDEANRWKIDPSNLDRPRVIAEISSSAGVWAGFARGRWPHTIDVRNFIQRNVAPYHGDEACLAAPTERTKARSMFRLDWQPRDPRLGGALGAHR